MPEQALIPTQLFTPFWERGHLMDAGAQDKVAPTGDGDIRGDGSPPKELKEGVLAQCRSRQDRNAQQNPLWAGQGPVANTFQMLHTFGARSDKGVMSALGKREQILGRAQEREGKAGAPVPTAAGQPQPHASPGLPSQASATICHTQGTAGGVGLGRGTHSP